MSTEEIVGKGARIPNITLSDGNMIPYIGLSVLRIRDNATSIVKSALKFRHITVAAD